MSVSAKIRHLEYMLKSYREGGIGPMSAGVGGRIKEIESELDELRKEVSE